MSEFQEYLDRLVRQRSAVERVRQEAEARGDVAGVRNAEKLLSDWALLIAKFAPANDDGVGAIVANH